MTESLETYSESEQRKIGAWMTQLRLQGPNLPRPYADFLRDGIHELRIKVTGDQVRVLYFFIHGKAIVLTHSFVKRQSKVPKQEIERAIMCREDYLKRFPTLEKLRETKDG
jgi:phage-related protein